jgi:hypothetical protein
LQQQLLPVQLSQTVQPQTATIGAVVKEICSGKLVTLQLCAGAMPTGRQRLLLQVVMVQLLK